ncbi:hypothetical protein B9Z55_022330 [Caenorhabditis nigoni]|uniref:Uncharacterized protein n=1 Tax=Caenorhabditis nigoni TaxID=1611254 RepID=A0A2G5SJL5_9PELO|nr:hypothetical protein B9Z55_022330 [Caenorhabditis nigoni]
MGRHASHPIERIKEEEETLFYKPTEIGKIALLEKRLKSKHKRQLRNIEQVHLNEQGQIRTAPVKYCGMEVLRSVNHLNPFEIVKEKTADEPAEQKEEKTTEPEPQKRSRKRKVEYFKKGRKK